MTPDVKHPPEVPSARTRQYPMRCAECGEKGVRPATIEYTVQKAHDGRIYPLHIPALRVLRCGNCGEVLFDRDADEQISTALRFELRLLTPAQIRDNINALSLTQKEFAARLGVAAETVSRWLTGTLIQSRAMDNLMRVYFAVPEVRAALAGSGQSSRLGAAVSEVRTADQPPPSSSAASSRPQRQTEAESNHSGAGMISYVIRIRSSSGQEGYFSFLTRFDGGGQWGFVISRDRGAAQQFDSEEAAEEAVSGLVSKCGLRSEDAAVEMIARDRTIALVLSRDADGNPVDHISVLEEHGKKYLLVVDRGEEVSDDLAEEVADVLIRSLGRLKEKLSA